MTCIKIRPKSLLYSTIYSSIFTHWPLRDYNDMLTVVASGARQGRHLVSVTMVMPFYVRPLHDVTLTKGARSGHPGYLTRGHHFTPDVDCCHLADKRLSCFEFSAVYVLLLSDNNNSTPLYFGTCLKSLAAGFDQAILVEGPWSSGALPGETNMVPLAIVGRNCGLSVKDDKKLWFFCGTLAKKL